MKSCRRETKNTFGDIHGVHVIGNDEEHDEMILKVMEWAREKRVRFSKDKVQYRVSLVRCMWNLVSAEGL